MAETREELKQCGRSLVEKRLVWGRSGNVSARTEPNAFLISAAGSDLGALRDEDLVLCQVESEHYDGVRRPSIERGLHQGVYQACEQAAAVVHSQPFYSTLVACSKLPVKTDVLPETMAYLGTVERVPYHHAGSRALAEATAARATTSQALLLDNHGVVCWGVSLGDALLRTEALEFLCRLLVASQPGAVALEYLGDSVVEDFHRHLRELSKSS